MYCSLENHQSADELVLVEVILQMAASQFCISFKCKEVFFDLAGLYYLVLFHSSPTSMPPQA